jgi:hypothetical protein
MLVFSLKDVSFGISFWKQKINKIWETYGISNIWHIDVGYFKRQTFLNKIEFLKKN